MRALIDAAIVRRILFGLQLIGSDSGKTKFMTDHASERISNGPSRRRFLFQLFPFAVFAGMAASIIAAATRFLRPIALTQEANWTNVLPLTEIKGTEPLMRSVTVEHFAGWSSIYKEHFIYVLPQQNNQVVSSVCPHENCDVAWRADTKRFYCPCHDSVFAADGSRVSGPARRGLDPLPTRVQNGVLQVQYQSFVNNTAERVVRG